MVGTVCGLSDVHWKLRSTSKKKWTGERREGLTMVCRWWDFQATLGKTILLSDIAGTALSTTRLVDWLLLMLLNPLVDFHRGRTMCFRAPDQKNQASGLPLGRGRRKKKNTRESCRSAEQIRLKILQRFYRSSDIDLTRLNYQRARHHRCVLSIVVNDLKMRLKNRNLSR